MQNLVQLELIADSRWWWCKSLDAFECFEFDRYGQGYEYLSRVPKTCDEGFFNSVKNTPWDQLVDTQKYLFRSTYSGELYRIGLVKSKVTVGSKAVTFDACCPTKQILDGLQQELNDPSPYMDGHRPEMTFQIQKGALTQKIGDLKWTQKYGRYVTLSLPKVIKSGNPAEHPSPDKIYSVVKSFLESDNYKDLRKELALERGASEAETPPQKIRPLTVAHFCMMTDCECIGVHATALSQFISKKFPEWPSRRRSLIRSLTHSKTLKT
jgi:hypothetical protein